MPRRLLLLAAATLTGCALEPSIPGTPAAPSGSTPAAETTARTLPFQLSAGKIFIDVTVNGRGPYPFAVDTGSPPTIIDLGLARDLGIPVIPMGRVGGAGEGSAQMGQAREVALSFGGVAIPRRPMLAVDLNERLAPFSARPIMGLIGNDFISSHIVEIDYPKRTITVRDPVGWEYTGDGQVLETRTRGHTFITGQISLGRDAPGAGETLPVRILIDTGAGLASSLTTPFVNQHHLLDRAGPRFRASVGWGLGGEVVHDVCRLDSIQLGGLRIDRPICSLSQDRAGALAAGSFDALIGGDLLARYKVIFDGKRRRVILEPGPDADAPFEYDMSGIALSGDAGRGPLRAVRVLDGSPAAQAGIQPDDIILAIDGREVRGSDRDQIRDLFRTDGASHTLRLKRAGDELSVEITLKRMVRAEPRPLGATA
jgi:hypothetical protein